MAQFPHLLAICTRHRLTEVVTRPPTTASVVCVRRLAEPLRKGSTSAFKAVYAYRAAQSGPREFCFLCYHKGQTFERLKLTLRTVLYKVVFCHKAVHRFETARRRSPGQEDTLEEEEEMNHTFY